MHVVVLGAGVIGLATAWCLSRDGHRVTLVERNQGVALETSHANGGQLSCSYVAPLASPSVLPKLPPWLLGADAPLRFRPQADLQQWRFCLAFLLACTQKQADLTTRRLLMLSFYSRALTRELVERESLDFAHARSGKLVVHSDPAAHAAACRLLEYQASLGCEQQALDADACVELEPALARHATAARTAGRRALSRRHPMFEPAAQRRPRRTGLHAGDGQRPGGRRPRRRAPACHPVRRLPPRTFPMKDT
jgi:D-amino-acid dehydrogenase